MQAAISTGPSIHLDHLAPLCFVLELPLIVTEQEQLELCKQFYPMTDVQHVPLQDLSLEVLANHFDTIITCGKFWAMELKPLLQMFYGKQPRFIFAPHGYSDKETLLNQPVAQDIELVYKLSRVQSVQIEMGNIRLWFYQKFKAHFDSLAQPFFPSEKTTVLYAPTWQTTATTTSFFDKLEDVIQLCKDNYHLLVKLHPLLEENDPAQFYRLKETYKDRVCFIENFPAIYPLLEKTDIYLGDYSSIGYDFLAFNRPLFFLKEGGKLQECGQLLTGSLDDPQLHLREKRKRLYQDTFGRSMDLEKFKLRKRSIEKS